MRISDWRSDVCSSDLRIRGYQCLETPAVQGQRGQVGLALLIRDDISAFQVGEVSPYTVCARVTLQGVIGNGAEPNVGARDLMVASVYIPPAGYPTRQARSEERRVGKECVSTCRSRWSPYP